MKTLVIAEKPSVAQDIVRALTPVAGKFERHAEYFENDAYLVTSAVGHLLEIQAPEEFEVKRGKWSFAHLPVIPPHFDLKPVEKTRTRLNAVVRLAKRRDVGALVNACDAGREGELIFRLIEQYAFDGKRGAKTVQRLWLQSMTPQAIREGFEHLRSDAQMQGLADAARSRSEADWLVGINGTRAFTAFNSREGGFFLTTVGRVQTPTLAIVVKREEEIQNHKPSDYWEVHATFRAEAGEYTGQKQPDKILNADEARRVAAAVAGKQATVREESRASIQSSPPLFDLTSLQREANGRFGFSAKTTLALAQSLYERHKALTYPRTDSRCLPEDYLGVVKNTFEMLAGSGMAHLAPHARRALDEDMVRPSRRIFDNSRVSDHFAIIPTLQAPGALSEAEQKIYDLVTRRFMAVFYPAAEYQLTTRTTTVEHEGEQLRFQSNGKVLVRPGWLAIYGKEAETETTRQGAQPERILPPVHAGEVVRGIGAEVRALKTKPPARYNEATLLGAMEGAGKLVNADDLRDAMMDKGLGTPATRAAIIEGLLAEKYLRRERRELIPENKAMDLMRLLRALNIDVLINPELTGDWEYKLTQMEQGKLSRERFMSEIAAMTNTIVEKAKQHNEKTIPGNYATLATPCPHCGGIVRENYRRFACCGKDGTSDGCGFSFTKVPGNRVFSAEEADQFLREGRIGPLEGFRSKQGWTFTAELVLATGDDGMQKLEFDFGQREAKPADLAQLESLGACPKCGGAVKEYGKNYVCERAVQEKPACDFKSATTILEQPIAPEQMQKLLADGRTDLLDKFVSRRTHRPFKARLTWDAEAGRVGFEFEPREGGSSRNARRGAWKSAAKTTAKTAAKTATKTTAAKRTTARKTAAKTAAKKTARGGSLRPSAALAAVIGDGRYGRGEVLQKLWAYIKDNNRQDPKNRRTIVADDKLRPLLGADSVDMFKLAGIVGKNLSAE